MIGLSDPIMDVSDVSDVLCILSKFPFFPSLDKIGCDRETDRHESDPIMVPLVVL